MLNEFLSMKNLVFLFSLVMFCLNFGRFDEELIVSGLAFLVWHIRFI
jgi:hypothetical protein